MCPTAAVVSPSRATGRRSILPDRVINRYAVFGVAEEDVVVVVESMIDPDLETVRIVYRWTTLCEVIPVTRKRDIRRRRIRSEKLLHRRKNQSLRDLETR